MFTCGSHQKARHLERTKRAPVQDPNFRRREFPFPLRSAAHDLRTRLNTQRPNRGPCLHLNHPHVKTSPNQRPGSVQVRACGSLVTEEQVSAMLVPLERFLVGFALFRPARPGFGSVSPARVWPELLSPESMKLKPIRTRVSAGTQ